MIQQQTHQIKTKGRGLIDLTSIIKNYISTLKVSSGLCHLFCHHTSCSLLISENYDESVKADLERIMAHLIPDGWEGFQHTLEGPDDMPAHVRSALTNTDVTIPIVTGELALGTWQGIYLWEHRTKPHNRKITITVLP